MKAVFIEDKLMDKYELFSICTLNTTELISISLKFIFCFQIAKRNAMTCPNCSASVPLASDTLEQTAKTPVCPQCKQSNQEAFQRAAKCLRELKAFICESKPGDQEVRKRSQDEIRALTGRASEILSSSNFVLGVAHHDAAARLLTISGNLNEGMEHLLASVNTRR